MKALLTGGTGFIGSHLAELLLDKSAEIFALVRDPHNLKWLKGLNIHLLEGDLLSIPSLPSDIDYVFHVAGLTNSSDVADYYTVNQQGTASLFKSLHDQKILPKKIICLSSLAAAGPSFDGKPVQESDVPHPITPYGKSKLMGEAEALKFKEVYPIVILRAPAVFGPRDKDFLQYFKWIKRGALPAIGSKQRYMSLCYVKDLARALYLCSQKEQESGEIFNIGDQNPCSYDEFGEFAGQAMGKKLKKVKIPIPIGYLVALIADIAGRINKKPSILNLGKFKQMRQRAWIADMKKAKEKLSFQPQYSLQEAVQETTNWYLKHNWL
jgi:nucleoside-diphosphate-sugar epimerase